MKALELAHAASMEQVQAATDVAELVEIAAKVEESSYRLAAEIKKTSREIQYFQDEIGSTVEKVVILWKQESLMQLLLQSFSKILDELRSQK